MESKALAYIKMVLFSSILQKIAALLGLLFSLRYSTPSSQAEILRHETTVTCVLFISREAVRKIASRYSGSKTRMGSSVELLGKLSLILYTFTYAVAFIFWQAAATRESIVICIAGLFEILIEPFVVRAITAQEAHVKVKIETMCTMLRTVHYSIALTHVDPLRAYVLARCAYSLSVFGAYTVWTMSSAKGRAIQIKLETTSQLLSVAWSLQRECICNLLLSESENLVAFYFLDKASLRVYIATNVIVGFVSRIIFKLAEETCDVIWSQSGGTLSKSGGEPLSGAMHFQITTCSMLFAFLLSHPKHVLSLLGCPVQPSDIFAVQMSLMRLPAMGMNGILESFFRSKAPAKQIAQRQKFIEVLAGTQLALSYIILKFYGLGCIMLVSTGCILLRSLYVFEFIRLQMGKQVHGAIKHPQHMHKTLIFTYLSYILGSAFLRLGTAAPSLAFAGLALSFFVSIAVFVLLNELQLIRNVFAFALDIIWRKIGRIARIVVK